MSAPLDVFGRSCPHCGELCPPGLAAHLDCALRVTRERVVERAEADIARERREERAKLDAAALRERARIAALVREAAEIERKKAARSHGSIDALVISTQRALALEALLTKIEEGEVKP